MTEIEHMIARTHRGGDQFALLWRGWRFTGSSGKIWLHYKTSHNSRETSLLFHHKVFRNEREFAIVCMECLEFASMLTWHPIEGPEELHKISDSDAYAVAYDAWKANQ